MASNAQQMEYFLSERRSVIQPLAVQSKKTPGFPNPTTKESILLHRLDLVLTKLETDVNMTPTFKQKTKIDEGMKVMFHNPEYHFPQAHADRARALFEKWQAENWGAAPVVKDEVAIKRESEDELMEDVEPQPKRRRTSKKSDTKDTSLVNVIRRPPPSHPIWGTGGIMHGVALKRGADGKNTKVLNDQYLKRDAKVYGSNGQRVGDWYPFQLVALFKGAHGSAMGGIAGSQDTGAYSVVVSGMYDDLDQDHGDYLDYSGSNSHDNEDPHNPPPSTGGTLALHASLASRKPVRVLRAASGKSKYAPYCGLRYDGLYRVVSVRQPKNAHGGRFEQFRLERLDGQAPIARNRPTPREIDDFARVKDGYPKYRDA